jgi:hypothetical protein
MKRSEMIEGLEITIRLCKEKNFSDEHFAQHMLRYMENLGMLPPFSHDVFYKNWQSSNRTEHNGNEWDKEDEKK